MKYLGSCRYIFAADSLYAGIVVGGGVEAAHFHCCGGRGLVVHYIYVGTVGVYHGRYRHGAFAGRLAARWAGLYVDTLGELVDRIAAKYFVGGYLIGDGKLTHIYFATEYRADFVAGIRLAEDKRERFVIVDAGGAAYSIVDYRFVKMSVDDRCV